jgi:hypothetical protein
MMLSSSSSHCVRVFFRVSSSWSSSRPGERRERLRESFVAVVVVVVMVASMLGGFNEAAR